MEDSSKKLSEQLLFKAKNAYDDGAEGTAQKARDYAEGYKAFLDAAKTEREAVKRGIEMAEAEGFRPFRFGESSSAAENTTTTTAESRCISFRSAARTSSATASA